MIIFYDTTDIEYVKYIVIALDNLDYREYTINENSIIEKGVVQMPREKFKTLTEQMFYILLCLKDECYGINIFDKIAHITDGKVTVGSGTMYTLLEQFLDAEMIREVRVEGRRRSYILTNKGKEMLEAETRRLRMQVANFDAFFGKEDAQ